MVRKKAPEQSPAQKARAEAFRDLEARVRSGWEHNYGEALHEMLEGNPARLLDLLRARRPIAGLPVEDYERLEALIVSQKRPRRGPPANEHVMEATRIARQMLKGKPKDVGRDQTVREACFLEYLARQVEGSTSPIVDPELVHDRLGRPLKRSGQPRRYSEDRGRRTKKPGAR
jgi:hypothetical protein